MMLGFEAKKITADPTLGEILIGKRQEKNLNIAQAASLTKISSNYLKALESGRYDQLPGDVYARNFLKVYANFLGLDSESLINRYLVEKKIYTKTKKIKLEEMNKPVEKAARIHFLVTPKIIRNIILGALVITFLVYLGIKVKGIFEPPFLLVNSPTNNLVTTQRIIEVEGQIEKEAILKINGQQVLADNEGFFSKTLTLQSGTNIIEIAAFKKHSQPATIYRQVVVIKDTNNNN